MSVPVVVVLAIVAMVSLVAIVAVIFQLISRLQRLARDLREIETDLMPRLAQVQQGTEVSSREMERIGRALDELGERRTD